MLFPWCPPWWRWCACQSLVSAQWPCGAMWHLSPLQMDRKCGWWPIWHACQSNSIHSIRVISCITSRRILTSFQNWVLLESTFLATTLQRSVSSWFYNNASAWTVPLCVSSFHRHNLFLAYPWLTIARRFHEQLHAYHLLDHSFQPATVYSLLFMLFMVALCNRADHYIFALWFLSIFFPSSSFFSSPNLSGRRLDVYHTSTHGVALVRI